MNAQPGPRSSVRMLAIPVAFFLVFFGPGAIQPFLIPFLRHRLPGLLPMRSCVVLAMVYFTFAGCRFLAGYVTAALGSKRTIVLGALGYFLFPILAYVLETYALLLSAAVLWGMAASLLWTAGSTQVLDASDRAHYGGRAGMLNVSAKVGVTLGVAALGAALQWQGYQGLFAAAWAVGALGVLAALAIPESPETPKKPRWSRLGGFYLRQRGLVMAVLFVVPGLAYGQVLGLINVFIGETLGDAYVGPITFAFMASGVLFSYLSGRASDRYGRCGPLWVSFLAGALGVGGMALVGSPWLAAGAAFLFGVQFGAVPTVVLAWLGDQVPPGERALGHAGIFAWRDLGIGASILLGGSVTQRGWPYRSVFLALGAVFLAAAVVSWGLLRDSTRP